MKKHYLKKQGLYDPFFEHDSCGVGFISHIKGKKSNHIIRAGIQILENLTHRGATGCDPLTGDGAGILIQVPDAFLKKECSHINISLPEGGKYGVGIVFLPTKSKEQQICIEWFEEIIQEEGLQSLGWRNVPRNSYKIGKVARSVEPDFKQIFITGNPDPIILERKLYIIRKRIEKKVRESDLRQKKYFYICSLSSKTLVYKGQLIPEQLESFYQDLKDPDMVSALALVHSRYSTNTFPTWDLAHPFRTLAHNGEINTLRGNINWIKAREMQFSSDLFGDDIKKILPVITPNASDSASFDNVLEMLVACGRSLPHAVMMMIPEAFSGHESMSQEKKDFYEYHSCLMEPWDGPASIVFTDGRYIGAVLDRNGLRPSRYIITKDDLVVMASEVGVLPILPSNVLRKGRLQPGKMFLVDTKEGHIIDDKELKHYYATKQPYGKWLKESLVPLESLPKSENIQPVDKTSLIERQKVFGYTLEDLKIILKPMAMEGKEPIGSMGDDTPLAVLSHRPKLLFNYFKQLFAQVTNPPIDPIREKIVMSTEMMIGKEENLLDETLSHCQRLKIPRPILTNQELEKIRHINQAHLKTTTISAFFTTEKNGLEKALNNLFKKADESITKGSTILILSDRGVNKENIPIPSLLVCAGLHHHLIRQGTRTKVSLVLETGEAREMHHFAVLIGYGANAINPYLVFETLKNELDKGKFPKGFTYEKLKENFIKATQSGLRKIISKMGISTIQSYCGAQIFEAVGLGDEIITNYFTETPSRIGGIGIKEVEEESLKRHQFAYPLNKNEEDDLLDIGGFYQWREHGEHHQYNPESIYLLQYAVRTGSYEIYKKYTDCINNHNRNLANLRGLLELKKRNSIPMDEVEPIDEIVKRFATGAMSYGSISKEAHETLAVAMNRLKGFSNSGEGGENPKRYIPDFKGDSRKSRIKQVAQGRFGVSIEYLVNADQLQIKMAQGAKPGEGGHLPGHKVSKSIAKTRHTTPGVGLISPPPHHDIYSIEDLSQLIYDLKNANPKADVSVKLVSEIGIGTVAAGVSKGKADHMLISGAEGGTGASPLSSIKHTGLPLELGLAETQQVLVMNDLRGRIRIQTDGQLKTGRDVIIAAMLGADEFGFATVALVSMGCTLQRKCHQNACSVGIATQDPELRKNFTGKPAHVMNFFKFVAQECREIMAQLGIRRFEDLIGRVDYLETKKAIQHWKAEGLDFTKLLKKPDVPSDIAIKHCEAQQHGLEKALDNELIERCTEAIEERKPIKFKIPIRNINRTVGATLSYEIAKRYGFYGLNNDTIQIHFTGSAGQSFGAFLSHGVTFFLEGDANDYLGKGLSGGKIIVHPPKISTFVPEENTIVGNVLFYGAIKGEAFIRGLAGERFCVRNSGVQAVVEGVGDHACEYMTGGIAVIIGPCGRNFAAGMSGGIAYVWDKDKTFSSLCNLGMVDLFPLEIKEDIQELKRLIERHFSYTQSTVAQKILDNWDHELPNFIKVYPRDYRRVVEEETKRVKEEKLKETLVDDGSYPLFE